MRSRSDRQRPLSMVAAASAFVLLATGLGLVGTSPAGAAVDTQLTRYPYLTDSVQHSITVNWGTTREETRGSVRWGPRGSCTQNTTTATKSTYSVGGVGQYQWKATVPVSPDTDYCYRVFLGSTDLLGSDPSPVFTTQAAAGSAAPYTFAVLGDTGQVDATSSNADQANLMRLIADGGARFAVQTGDFGHPNNDQKSFGDLVHTGPNTSAIFGPAFWKDAGATIPMFTVPGNHGVTNNAMLVNFPQDKAVSGSDGTYQMLTYCCTNGTTAQSQQSGWYAFDAGNARFYMLTTAWSDTNLGTLEGTIRSPKLYQNDYDNHWTPSSPEYQWLRADLQAHAETPLKLAFFHFPLYSDNPDERSDTNLQGAGSLEGLLGQYGVDMAFSGHAHIYQRNKVSPEGLVSYVTGGGGAAVQSLTSRCSTIDAYAIGWSSTKNVGERCGAAPVPASPAQVHHYLRVTVDDTEVTVTPTDSSGRTFDVKTYEFSGGTPTRDTTPPTAPANLTASPSGMTSVSLSWSASRDNVGVTRYEIFRDGVADPVGSTDGATRYTDTRLAPGTRYTYTVRAVDAAGNRSAAGSGASTTTRPDDVPPSAPGGLKAHPATSRTVPLSWSASTDNVGVRRYQVYRDGGGTPIAVTTATSYTDTGRSPRTTYSYTVRAVDAAGNASASSRTVTATTGARHLTLVPVADRTVNRRGARTGRGRLTVASRPATNLLLKFRVPATCSMVTSASLRLTVGPRAADRSAFGGRFYATATGGRWAGWRESSVTWSTAPRRSRHIAPVTRARRVLRGHTYRFGVTRLVPAAGGTFTIRGASASRDAAGYLSAEGSHTSGPRLDVGCL